jgi:hypothetical protein
MFYARTPYMLPIMKLLDFIGAHIDFTYPGHLHDLGQSFWENFFKKNATDFRVLKSRPSFVETGFRQNFIRTLFAYILKSPWYIFRRNYSLVGGWEIFAYKHY